jgi:hypothetical protein
MCTCIDITDHKGWDECSIKVVETIPDGVFTQEELRENPNPMHEVILAFCSFW